MCHMKFYIFIALCGLLYSQKLDVFELLDSITDSLDYFIFNYKTWNEDFRFTLTILESETKRILDGYVKSELDFDLLYVPVIRRFHGQAQILSEKIKPHFINDKNPKELLFHHLLFDSNLQAFLLYPHRISEKKLIWSNHDHNGVKPSMLNDYFVCIMDLLTPDLCQNKNFLDNEHHSACLKLMTRPPQYMTNNQFPFEIVNIQLLFSILVNKIGCGIVFESELGKYGKNNFNWQSELCSNAHYHWSKNQGGLNSTLLKTEVNLGCKDQLPTATLHFISKYGRETYLKSSCLLLGFVDFLSKPRLKGILSHFTKDSSSYEMTGCILTPSRFSQSPLVLESGGEYVPFSHPFAYDFAYPLSFNYQFKPKAGDDPNEPVRSGSSNKVCNPLFTNLVLRILIMYMRFILDPGPTKFKAHWVEPEMYMEQTLNAIQYVPRDKTTPLPELIDANEEIAKDEQGIKPDANADVNHIKIEENKYGNNPELDKLIYMPKMPLDRGDEGAGYYIESLAKTPISHYSSQGKQAQFGPESALDLDVHYLKANYSLIFGGLLCFLAFCLYRHYRRSKWIHRGKGSILALAKKIYGNSKNAQRKSWTHDY